MLGGVADQQLPHRAAEHRVAQLLVVRRHVLQDRVHVARGLSHQHHEAHEEEDVDGGEDPEHGHGEAAEVAAARHRCGEYEYCHSRC